FSSRRRHTRSKRDWSSDVCSSDLTTWDGTVETWDQIYTRQGPSQYTSLVGLIPRVLDYTAPITLRGEMSTNGATVNTVDDAYPRSEERRVGKESKSGWAPCP